MRLMNYDFLKNNPKLSGIPNDKLEFLMEFAATNHSNNANDMAKQLSNAASMAKTQGFTFSNDETNVLIEILKQEMPPEEQAKVDRIMRLMSTFRPRR